MTSKASPYRLAIRKQGNMIMAYFAEHGTMENAKLLSTMSTAIADQNADAFEAFKTFSLILFIHMHEQAMPGVDASEMFERKAPPSEVGRGNKGPGE